MKRFVRVAALAAALVLASLAAAAPALAANPVQLALGDSWAFGFGASVPSEGGYVPRLHTALKAGFDCSPSPNPKPGQGCEKLELVTLAAGGATTPTLIQNQLPGATALLHARNADHNPRNNVEVVTVHIGGNDVVGPIIAACIAAPGSPSCVQVVQSELAAYRADLDDALSALRAAAGSDARIVIGTYDNPIATCFLGQVPGAVLLGAIVLEGTPPAIPAGLHDIMREVAADHGVEVAEVYGDLAPEDWVGDGDCLHPVDSGYAKVAAAFEQVLIGS
jgi:lysophospholipase L1-like esterase